MKNSIPATKPCGIPPTMGFTIIELLIAVVLVLVAISIALLAMIGSNSVLVRTEIRGALAEASRTTAATLRQATNLVSIVDPAVVTGASYPNQPNSDLNATFTRECFTASPAGRCPNPAITKTAIGYGLDIRQFSPTKKQSVCYLIGRAETVEDSNG